MSLRTGARTDIGKVRDGNEDRLAVVVPDDPEAGVVLCVADGMGGHPAGEVASQIAVDRLGRWEEEASKLLTAAPPDPDAALAIRLRDLVREAHEAILEVGNSDPDKTGLGTTIVAALLRGDRMHVVHCGDSRAYLLRKDTLEQLTQDHVVIEGGVRFLSAHVGMIEGLDLDETDHDLARGDRVLLCSDGLTDMVPGEAFGVVLHQAEDPEQAAASLVDLANLTGGLDNVTCVVAFVDATTLE